MRGSVLSHSERGTAAIQGRPRYGTGVGASDRWLRTTLADEGHQALKADPSDTHRAVSTQLKDWMTLATS